MKTSRVTKSGWIYSFLLLLAPSISLAEPGVSQAHIPYLLAFASGISAVFAVVIIKATSGNKLLNTPLRRWGLGIILLVFFSAFLVPLIMIFGGILITGRTM